LKILFLTPYPIHQAPSQRFRFEQYYSLLDPETVQWHETAFMTKAGWVILFKNGKQGRKIFYIFWGFVRRIYHLFLVAKSDFVFIHRELTPIGPPIFEWFIAKVLQKKIIYDFDDAIWLNDGHDGNSLWTWLKWRRKVTLICKWSWKVSVGNDYLAAFAANYNDHVIINPTVVNTYIHQKISITNKHKLPVIGWTGSHSTLFYLDEIIPVLQSLEKEMDFVFLVIANKNPQLPIKNFKFIHWNESTEILDLSQLDIGIMPLENTEWAKGKCGFKLIQYGAMGIASVASPVGANKQVVINGETGLFASNTDEWKTKLKTLILAPAIREKMGLAARKHIENHYSVSANQEKWMSLFVL
jgi:glycosyltransferase involved in cell wall biosynthesis